MQSFDRILLIDKPKGWTSFDVVAKIRGHLQAQKRAMHDAEGDCGNGIVRKNGVCRCKVKVGHAGTLDPMATGLLTILTGKNTSKAMEYTKLDKTYEAEMTLGRESTTGDSEGEFSTYPGGEEAIEALDVQRLKEVIATFIGDIQQTPPAHSAIKINGQRAYKLAREGKEVDMPTRMVNIYDIRETALERGKITFTADVGSGTYIRSLVQDIGRSLGTGAYMSDLRRTKVGEFSIDDASTVEEFLTK